MSFSDDKYAVLGAFDFGENHIEISELLMFAYQKWAAKEIKKETRME